MVNILILIVFLIAIYEGIRNGILNELIGLIVIIIGFWVAFVFSDDLSRWLEVLIPYPSPTDSSVFALYPPEYAFSLDQSFYLLLSFFIIFFAFFILTQFLFYILEPLNRFEENIYVDTVGGAVVSLMVAYFLVFLVLFIMSTMASEGIQEFFNNNALARLIVERSPILSNIFYNEFVARLG